MMISLRVPLSLSHTFTCNFQFHFNFRFSSFTFSLPPSLFLCLALSVKSNGSLITEWRHYTRIRTQRWCVWSAGEPVCDTSRIRRVRPKRIRRAKDFASFNELFMQRAPESSMFWQ